MKMGVDYIVSLYSQYPILYNPIFLGLFATGIIFIIAGFILYKIPPKNINFIYGYRSKQSMKNQEVWDFSQTYSAKLMIKLGLFYLLTSLFGLVYLPRIEIALMITFIILLLGVVFLFIKVEQKLKQKFK